MGDPLGIPLGGPYVPFSIIVHFIHFPVPMAVPCGAVAVWGGVGREGEWGPTCVVNNRWPPANNLAWLAQLPSWRD